MGISVREAAFVADNQKITLKKKKYAISLSLSHAPMKKQVKSSQLNWLALKVSYLKLSQLLAGRCAFPKLTSSTNAPHAHQSAHMLTRMLPLAPSSRHSHSLAQTCPCIRLPGYLLRLVFKHTDTHVCVYWAMSALLLSLRAHLTYAVSNFVTGLRCHCVTHTASYLPERLNPRFPSIAQFVP